MADNVEVAEGHDRTRQLEQKDIGLARLVEWPIGSTGSTVICNEGDIMELDDATRDMPQLEQKDIGLARLVEWPIGSTGSTVICNEGDIMELDDATRDMPQLEQKDIGLARLVEWPIGSTGSTVTCNEGDILELDDATRDMPQLEQKDIGLARLVEWPIGSTGRTVTCNEGDIMELDDATRDMPQGASGSAAYEKRSVSRDGEKLRPAKPARTLSAFTGLMDRTIKQHEIHPSGKAQDGRRSRMRARSQSPGKQEKVQPTTSRSSRSRNPKQGPSSIRPSPMVSQLQCEERLSYRKELYELQVKWKEEKAKRKADQRSQNLRRIEGSKTKQRGQKSNAIPCNFM